MRGKKPLFEIRPVDREYYEEHLAEFLPEQMVDVHTHVWLERLRPAGKSHSRSVTWPSRVARENSAEDLL